jgi:hypothetical protein
MVTKTYCRLRHGSRELQTSVHHASLVYTFLEHDLGTSVLFAVSGFSATSATQPQCLEQEGFYRSTKVHKTVTPGISKDPETEQTLRYIHPRFPYTLAPYYQYA